MVRPPDDLLVSDAERQVVIDELREHTADGRLTLDEFEQRVEETLRARTGADLRVVTRELPSLRPEPTARAPHGLQLPISPQLIVAAVVVVVALMAGMWWALIPLWFVFGGCLGGRSRHASHSVRSERDEPVTYV